MKSRLGSGKGMIYTSFALLSASMLLMLVMGAPSTGMDTGTADATRISKASFFLESVLEDMDRSLRIATRRALSGATNYVVVNGEPLAEPGRNVTSALVNGSISGDELNNTGNASLSDWSGRVSDIASRSGYKLGIELRNYSFETSGFEVKSSYRVFARLEDPSTLASFNETRSENASVSVNGLEDPMLVLRSKGRYVAKYEKCGFEKPARELYEADIHSDDSVQGKAAVNPSDLSEVGNQSERILVVDDIDNYTVGDVNDFAGAVSAEPNSSSGYTTEYAFDLPVGDVSEFGNGSSLILNEGEVWNSSFRNMFQERCYVETGRGPGVFDRLGNELVSASGDGLATLIEVPELPSELRKEESAVGYVYFNGTGYGSLNSIRGVTPEHSWFKLDDHHVNLWSLEELAY